MYKGRKHLFMNIDICNAIHILHANSVSERIRSACSLYPCFLIYNACIVYVEPEKQDLRFQYSKYYIYSSDTHKCVGLF